MDEDVFDGVVSNLPVDFQAGEENFAIDTVDAFGLLELREKGRFDLALMSCRPVIERDDSAQLEIFQKLLSNKSNMLFGIYDEDGRIIGRVSFYDYNSRNLSVEMGYVLLEEYQGRGIMSSALESILSAVFQRCKVNKIYAQTCAVNVKSRKLLENSGFVIDGRLREHHEYHSVFYDDYIYSVLKKDFMRKEETDGRGNYAK